jgi:hypothetical protein
MANIIIKSEERLADEAYVSDQFEYDHSDPAMREAVEIIAARTRETMEDARRYQ